MRNDIPVPTDSPAYRFKGHISLLCQRRMQCFPFQFRYPCWDSSDQM